MWDGVDRRRFSRVKYPCLITVYKKTIPEFSTLTHTENISVGGMRVIIERRIEAMTEVEIEIDLDDTLSNIISKGTVAWVKRVLPAPQEESAPDVKRAKVITGTVKWVKEIAPTQQGEPSHYDTGIRFTTLKESDRRRITNVVNNFLGRGR